MGNELPPPEPLVAPPVPSGEGHGRRRRLWVIAAIVGGVAGFVLLGLIIPESWTYLDSGSGQLINDNMDRGDGPFVAESDPYVSLSYEDGGYEMSLVPVETPSGNWQTARALWSESTKRSVRVAASFDVRDDASGWMVGVGCVGPTGQYYFVLDSVGAVGIIAEDTIREVSQPLTGADPGTEELTTTTGRLELECRGGGNGPTELVGFVDGQEVVSALHHGGWESFRGMAVTAAVQPNQSAEVMWDDPLAETL